MCKPTVSGVSFPLLEQMQVILPHVFPREVIGALAKMAGKVFNDSHVASDCRWRVVTTLEFLQHPLS